MGLHICIAVCEQIVSTSIQKENKAILLLFWPIDLKQQRILVWIFIEFIMDCLILHMNFSFEKVFLFSIFLVCP